MRMTLRCVILRRVAQLVHEALHHLLVLRDVRVQELEDQAVVHHRVFHQQHGAEGALADLLDVLVAALEHVAGLQRVDVELLLVLDLGGARRRRPPPPGASRCGPARPAAAARARRRAAGATARPRRRCGAMRRPELRARLPRAKSALQFLERAGGARAVEVGSGGEPGLELHADVCSKRLVVGEARERVHRLDAACPSRCASA